MGRKGASKRKKKKAAAAANAKQKKKLAAAAAKTALATTAEGDGGSRSGGGLISDKEAEGLFSETSAHTLIGGMSEGKALKLDFQEAVKHVHSDSVRGVGDAQAARLYGLFMQTTKGPPPKTMPQDEAAKTQWQAWRTCLGLSQKEAMQEYIDLVAELDPEFLFTDKDPDEPASAKKATDPRVQPASELPPEMLAKLKEQLQVTGQPGSEAKPRKHESVFAACGAGDAVWVQMYIKAGKNVNVKDPQGVSPLMWAADCGSHACVELLVNAAGIEIDAEDSDGQTALHYAAMVGEVRVVECLLEAGADRSKRDGDDNTPADVAQEQGNDEAGKLLLLDAPV